MNDEWWLKIWEALIKFMPAIGGSFLSLRYLPKEESDLKSIIYAFVGGLLLAIYGGNWAIGYYGITEDWAKNGITGAIAVIGLIFLNKLIQTVKSISVAEIKEWIKERLRAWVN